MALGWGPFCGKEWDPAKIEQRAGDGRWLFWASCAVVIAAVTAAAIELL